MDDLKQMGKKRAAVKSYLKFYQSRHYFGIDLNYWLKFCHRVDGESRKFRYLQVNVILNISVHGKLSGPLVSSIYERVQVYTFLGIQCYSHISPKIIYAEKKGKENK